MLKSKKLTDIKDALIDQDENADIEERFLSREPYETEQLYVKKNRFLLLRSRGESYSSIGKTLGICKRTCINWSKKHALELSNLTAIERDRLKSQLLAIMEKNNEFWGKQLELIYEELLSRPDILSGVSPVHLIDSALKIRAALKQDEEKILFKKKRNSSLDQNEEWQAG